MANITINDRRATFEDGITILDAARQLEIHVPTFCYYPGLEPLGACRICLVEIEGQRRLQPACITAIADGMVVQTNSEAVRQANRGNLEMILSSHPLDCPVCDKGGECELQEMVMDLGPRQGTFEEKKRVFREKDLPLNDVIIFNANRCIQCLRCVRICNDVVGAFALGAIERGNMTEISGFGDDIKNCDQCGNCIEVCPVGALMNRPYRYLARPWDLVRTETTCPYCGTGCRFTVETRAGQLVRVRSPQESGLNAETLCAKGRFGIDLVKHPDRVRHPMVRRHDQLVAVGWDEAAAFLRERLPPLSQGGRIGGLISPRLSNESLYGFQRLMRCLFRSNQIDAFERWNQPTTGEHEMAPAIPLARLIREHYSRRPLTELLQADLTFICGCDTSEENPVSDYLIRRSLAENPTRLFVTSNRPGRLMGEAEAAFCCPPGGEPLLIAQILEEVLRSVPEAARQALPALENLGNLPPPDSASSSFVSTLSAALYEATSISILFGTELLRGAVASASLQLLYDLIGILKQLGKPVWLQGLLDRPNQLGAWDLGLLPGHLPGAAPLDDPEARKRYAEAWSMDPPVAPGGDFNRMLALCDQGELESLYLVGVDPLLAYPDRERLEGSLSRVKFLLVQDAYLSETAARADLLLPTPGYGEQGGSFTNNEGRVQPLGKFWQAPVEAKTDNQCFSWIVQTLGVEHAAFEPDRVAAELYRQVPLYQSIDEAALETLDQFTGVDPAPAPALKPYAPAIPLPPTREGMGLITGNCRSHSGHLSEKSATLNTIQDQAYVELNRADARALGIGEHDRVSIRGNCGEVTVRARLNKDFPHGLLFIPDNFRAVPLNRLFKAGQYPCPVRIERAAPRDAEERWS